MSALSYTLQGLVLASYLGAAVVYLRYFQTGARELRWLCRPALLISLVFHVAYLLALGLRQGAIPLIAPGQAMTVMAISMTTVYLFIEIRLGHREMGVFVLGFSALLQLLSVFLTVEAESIPEALRTTRLPAHALAGLVGYGMLGLGGVFAVLLLLLRSRIKNRRIGVVYQRLPSLRLLDTMSTHANTAGFALLTVALVSGALWSGHEWGTLFPRDPKLIGFAVVWLLYGVSLASRWIPGWGRRLRAIWTVGSFCLLSFNFAVMDFLFESIHSW